jgi:hypothetical protein
MHQYAYAVEYARTFDIACILPSEWEGSRLFQSQRTQTVEDDELRLLLNQSQPEFDHLGARTRAIETYNNKTGAKFEYLDADDASNNWSGKTSVFIDSVCAYSASIFQRMSAHYLMNEALVFSDEVRNTDCFKTFSARRNTYDVAHLRRDDIANPAYNKNCDQGYSVLSKESYLTAFRKFGFDPTKVEWVSDDYLGKWHTDRPQTKRGGWTYPVGSEYLGPELIFDWLPDFIKLYFARTIFRANSSFSWWAGFLSPTAKVYSPVIHRQSIYGKASYEEVDYDFVEGNHPHWMFGCGDIRFKEESRSPIGQG